MNGVNAMPAMMNPFKQPTSTTGVSQQLSAPAAMTYSSQEFAQPNWKAVYPPTAWQTYQPPQQQQSQQQFHQALELQLKSVQQQQQQQLFWIK